LKTTPVHEVMLDESECLSINRILDHLFNGSCHIDIDLLLNESHMLSHELPVRLRRALYDFKMKEVHPGIIIKHSTPVFPAPPTPHELPQAGVRTATRDEALHVIYSSLVGEAFTWNSIQRGNLVNHILPVKEHEDLPMSSGSSKFFDLHTEDAFHPLAGEYLTLLCLRNPNEVPTILSYIGDVDIPQDAKRILFQSIFAVGANLAHDAGSDRTVERLSILFGNQNAPYFRINVNVLNEKYLEGEARGALEAFAEKLRAVAQSVTLRAGDVLFIDNLRVAHARPPYSPSYDGTDRWLKRLYVTESLKKSRGLRATATSRLVEAKKV